MSTRRWLSARTFAAALALALVVEAAAAAPVGYDGLTAPTSDAMPAGASYMLTEHWGRSWSDAEKSPANADDDLMCWAATAANILAWTGWGRVDDGTGHVMTTADEMFADFQAHWTDTGGMMNFAWDWWFDGTNDSQNSPGWARVDVAGGGFYAATNFDDYYTCVEYEPAALPAINAFLQMGRGVGIAIYRPNPGGGLYGHAVTVWGVDTDPSDPGEYLGLWITDSDDDKYNPSPPDRLRYYDVRFADGKWRLDDYAGVDTWYIGSVQALAVPEPATGLLAAAGAIVLSRRRRR